MKKLTPDFETTIAGIPCGIIVDYYNCVLPSTKSAHLCDSDLDFYGYTEFEFTVLDSKGYKADWLQDKVTEKDEERLLNEYRDSVLGEEL